MSDEGYKTTAAIDHLAESAQILKDYCANGSHAFWLHVDRDQIERASAMLDALIVDMENEGPVI